MEGNSWERPIRTERNGQSAIVGIEGENHARLFPQTMAASALERSASDAFCPS